ncbi:hypothetical protein [Weissella confusa]|uniref:hypothetical protein n=1 Tax=Weissella confusa TaxID=1583 RepID=UPI0022E6B69E|nr:hypothetical protein [Weissella confusa]
MQAVISEEQQVAVLQKAARSRMSRQSLAEKLGISHTTLRRVLDSKAPVVVAGKVFTKVNDWLIADLTK